MSSAPDDRQRHAPTLRSPEPKPFADPYLDPDRPGEFARRAAEEFFRQYDSAKASEQAKPSES